MNRPIRAVSVLLLVVLLFTIAGCSKSQDTSGINTDINEYSIQVEFNPNEKSLLGREKVVFVNKTKGELKEVYFYLYPNAFRKEETVPFVYAHRDMAYPAGFEPGYIDILSITSKGKKMDYLIAGAADIILKVNLEKPLKPMEKAEFTIDFKVVIPPAEERFGYSTDIFNLGNWYPVAAVCEESGWKIYPYYPIGDPFYSDIANYTVKITAPREYIIAASGDLVKEETSQDKKTVTFQAKAMRDFAWVTSKKFKIEEEIVDGITVKSYHLEDHDVMNKVAVSAAVKSIKIFNEVFGKYPYNTYSVVETQFPTAMEYPGLVFVNRQCYLPKARSEILENYVVHETAHQWWFSAVGNDQIAEAWLDESFAVYSEVIYYEKEGGERAAKYYYDNYVLGSYERRRNNINKDEIILKPLYEFEGWNDYAPLVYRKGAVMLHTLRQEVGDEAFFKILSTYYDKYKFHIATTRDFIGTVEEITGKKWDAFFDRWLLDKAS